MSYGYFGIEFHGKPVDAEGTDIPDAQPLHMMVWFDCDSEAPGDMPGSIYQLSGLSDLRIEDGTCPTCQPKPKSEPLPSSFRRLETAAACVGCGKPIQRGQVFTGSAKAPKHVGC